MHEAFSLIKISINPVYMNGYVIFLVLTSRD